MKEALRSLVLFVAWVGISSSGTTVSANASVLKCNSNKDRVWVYDSLVSFDIQAKLNCGETVEIIERVKDYVKIRALNGIEGYVPDTQISDLPAFVDQTPDVGTVAKQVQAKEIAKVAASESPFQIPDVDTRISSSPGPAIGLQGKDASQKRPTPVGPTMPFTTLAEINPHPDSGPMKSAPSHEGAKSSAAQPSALSSDAVDGTSSRTPDVPASVAISIVAPGRLTGAANDEEETPDFKPEDASADPACQAYFSAYGLTSTQLKWIAQNRKKMFPSVCPAPEPSKVNFVIIFTHDVDFYNATMPKPVHKVNGFSDFQPMTTIDNALVHESGANRAHREYVWIFLFAKGGFNPETFSPHRRYQFTKEETNSLGSKAGPKAVEDAFRFIETTNR